MREKYLKAILRQNIAFFDRLGPGEVTTRIETDTHLIQEGISDKISISVFFIAIFISGFVIAVRTLQPHIDYRASLACRKLRELGRSHYAARCRSSATGVSPSSARLSSRVSPLLEES